MKYQAKSAIIGRMKRPNKEQEDYPCFIHLFSINDPHKTGKVPEKMLDYPKVRRVSIKGLDIEYLLPGNDILLNNLTEIDIEVTEPHITITGNQK